MHYPEDEEGFSSTLRAVEAFAAPIVIGKVEYSCEVSQKLLRQLAKNSPTQPLNSPNLSSSDRSTNEALSSLKSLGPDDRNWDHVFMETNRAPNISSSLVSSRSGGPSITSSQDRLVQPLNPQLIEDRLAMNIHTVGHTRSRSYPSDYLSSNTIEYSNSNNRMLNRDYSLSDWSYPNSLLNPRSVMTSIPPSISGRSSPHTVYSERSATGYPNMPYAGARDFHSQLDKSFNNTSKLLNPLSGNLLSSPMGSESSMYGLIRTPPRPEPFDLNNRRFSFKSMTDAPSPTPFIFQQQSSRLESPVKPQNPLRFATRETPGYSESEVVRVDDAYNMMFRTYP